MARPEITALKRQAGTAVNVANSHIACSTRRKTVLGADTHWSNGITINRFGKNGKDKKLVRVDTSSVSITSTSAEARKSHFYLRLKDWIPYDRPDVTRKASLPRERHDHSVPFFSVDRKLVEAFARDMRKSDPVKAIRDTYADMFAKLDKLAKLTPAKISESEYADELHWDAMRRVCAEDRVKQGWIGNDILHPVPWNE